MLCYLCFRHQETQMEAKEKQYVDEAVQVEEKDLAMIAPVVLTDIQRAYDPLNVVACRHKVIDLTMTELEYLIKGTKTGLDLLRNLDQHNNQALFEDYMLKRRTLINMLDTCNTEIERVCERYECCDTFCKPGSTQWTNQTSWTGMTGKPV